MSVYITTPKAIEEDILTASAAYTTNLDEPDTAVTFALDENLAIVFRHNADDTIVTKGLIAECSEDEALIAAAKAFAEELDAVGYEGYAKWLRAEVKDAELAISGEE